MSLSASDCEALAGFLTSKLDAAITPAIVRGIESGLVRAIGERLLAQQQRLDALEAALARHGIEVDGVPLPH